MSKIALTLIVKDDSEAEMLDRCLKSFKPAVDGIFVTVTGPSGLHSGVHKVVEYYGGKSQSVTSQTHPQIYKTVNGKTVFANFAEARNVSFDFVPEGYDWILWADVDDVLLNPLELREIADESITRKLDAVHFTYWYAVRLKEGKIDQVIIEHHRERLIRPGKFKWVSRLHEVCVPKDNFNPKYSKYLYSPKEGRNVVWVHLTDEERISTNIERNKQLLMWEIEDTKWRDPRPIFYLAKIYFDYATELFQTDRESALKEDDRALELIGKYLEMSGWEEERSNALNYAGLIHTRAGRLQQAIETYHKAIEQYPTLHLNYLRLVDCYYKTGHYLKGDFWLDVASKLPSPDSDSMGDTIGSSYEIKELAATLEFLRSQRREDLEGAKRWATIRANLRGSDDGLLESLKEIEDLNYAVTGIVNLTKWLKDYKKEDYIEKVLEVLPSELKEQQAVLFISNKVLPPKKWGKKSIVYFASFGDYHFEKWSAKSMEKGIGGSETAVIQLSKEWVKQGYEVTVYCDCGEDEGVHDGVIYKNWTLFNWNDEFNILILWRSPHLLDREIKARKLFMDLHDVISPIDWTEERSKKVDKIFVKSKMHREYLPRLEDNKFAVISNGIEL